MPLQTFSGLHHGPDLRRLSCSAGVVVNAMLAMLLLLNPHIILFARGCECVPIIEEAEAWNNLPKVPQVLGGRNGLQVGPDPCS